MGAFRYFVLTVALAAAAVCQSAIGDVIIDNGAAGTSSTGTWQVSGAAGAYGTNSLWSYKGATYTWSFTPTASGVYRVSMWWTALSSRYASVPIAINYSGGTANVTVNQQTNGGQWNSLGEYSFNAGTAYRVTLTATPTSSPPSTCADAVRFELISANMPPTAVIDSITPSPAESGAAVQFTGHGTDNEGAVTGWEWSSNINGIISTAASFTTNALSNGAHTISFRVKDEQGVWSAMVTQVLTVGPIPTEFIIDNGQTGTSSTGTWQVSGTAGAYGTNSLWSYRGATYTWSFTPVKSGTYDVSMWWTALSSRYAIVPVTITYSEGTANLTVDQRANGGQWNSLGEYWFDAGITYSVKLTATPSSSPPSTCADAVRFTYIPAIPANTPPTAFIDSITPNHAAVNAPVTFVGHGEDSEGAIAAYLWKVDDVKESNAATFVTSTLAEGLHTVSFAVQDSSGAWSASVAAELVVGNIAPDAFIDSISPNPAKLDETITFAGHGQDSDGNIAAYKWESDSHGQLSDQASFSISAASLGSGTYTVAFSTKDNKGAWSEPATQTLTVGNVKPTAYIDSITPAAPNVGEKITFTGHGADIDGSVVAYSWDSSIDGHLSDSASFSTTALSLGDQIITLTVTDNEGAVSIAATQEVKVNEIPFVAIIDNGQSGTSYTGIWPVSGAAGSYGTNSLWSYNGATYTWSFTPTSTSVYRISMWWTALSTRSNSIPVRIIHGGGTTNLTINQQTNGGKWNSLGEYALNAGTTYSVTLTAVPTNSPPSTCADAVKFEKISMPSLPAADFYADRAAGRVPLTVQFNDTSLGIITSRVWNFGDGATSTQTNPSHTYTTAGTYTVSLTVTNVAGSNTATKTDYVVTAVKFENIYACQLYSWNGLFLSEIDDMLSKLGAVKKDTYWLYKNVAKNITYSIRYVTTVDGMLTALAEPNSHVIVTGHSNYGLGGAFASDDEFHQQRIDSMLYIDDDRLLKYGSEMVSIKVDGVQIGQAYPNWQPIYKDGTSGLMPYDFSEGSPPYNYYVTYRIPGDSTNYRVELMDGSYIERFPDSSVPPWYSKSGAKPDPNVNPQYFIINPEQYYSRGEVTGKWLSSSTASIYKELGYNGYNYLYLNAGTGTNKVTFICGINAAGRYSVSGSWFPQADHAKDAEYIINHAAGTTTVYADQTKGNTSSFWNNLGTFDFAKGETTIVATDKASAGVVIADGILLTPLDNPTNLVRAEFKASVRTGAVGLTVQFTDYSKIMKTVRSRLWNFGDGFTSSNTSPSHTYAAAGIYSVSLTVVDSTGAQSTETKSDYIVVGVTVPVSAGFYATGLYGVGRTTVRFYDQSIGGITNWSWNFGDGATSKEKNPTHVYYLPGKYTVQLTVSGANGSNTHTESDYVCIGKTPIYSDSAFAYKAHFYTGSASRPTPKQIVKTKGKLQEGDLKYDRLFLGMCNSANYYTDTFHRGIMFYTIADVEHYTGVQYLNGYLKGLSDDDILTQVNNVQPVHEYYNFNLKPPSMR